MKQQWGVSPSTSMRFIHKCKAGRIPNTTPIWLHAMEVYYTNNKRTIH